MRIIRLVCYVVVLMLAVSNCTKRTDIVLPDKELGSSVFEQKCSNCHDVNRAFTLERDEASWRKLIVAMRQKTGSDISDNEVELIVGHHIERQKKARELFEKKCKNCHERRSLMSPPQALKTPEEWERTVRRMMSREGEALDDESIDILVYYHLRTHTLITSAKLERESEMFGLAPAELFTQRCSTCHSLEKALQTVKDRESWRKTILTMEKRAGRNIKHSDVVALVNFHMERQNKEQELFSRDCTQCHGADVALGAAKTLTDEQWRETAEKMLGKAGKKITEEELDMLAAYHTRYEKTMADLAEKKCTQCHDNERIVTRTETGESWNQIIVRMSEKEGSDIAYSDVIRLVRYHMDRQRIEEEAFMQNCSECHQAGQTLKEKKSRDEWKTTIRRMMAKTNRMISDEELNILVAYHIRRFR
jgi:mono/diheme cytochrome c family protein